MRIALLTLLGAVIACGDAPRQAAPPAATPNSSSSPADSSSRDSAARDSAVRDSIARDSARADSVRAAAEARDEVMHGYVVRGSDESSFKVCGKPGVHLIRDGRPPHQLTIYTQYRFRATEPLRPVYFKVRARIVQDTATVGPWHYKSIIQISYTFPDDPAAKPACPPPPRGSLIERETNAR